MKHIICPISLSESQMIGDQGVRESCISACTLAEAAKWAHYILGNDRIET